jgi:hypothetical protein
MNLDEKEDLANKYKEIAWMTREDLLTRQEKHQNLQELFNKVRDKYYEAQSKLDEIMREQGNNTAYNESVFERDKQLFSLIKEQFVQNKHPIIHLSYLKEDHGDHHEQNPPPQQPPLSADQLALARYSYYRPTYYSLIKQEFENALKSGANMKATVATYERDFVTTIRGIFDSKFNEIIMARDHTRLVSFFADFVYGWLTVFTIDPRDRKVRGIIPDDKMDIDFRRLQFYHTLLNPKLMKVWDVVTFREFLEEKVSNDEIFFYLYCRNMLFDGAQLDYLAGSINIIHLVRLDKIEKFFDVILRKMDRD